MSPKSTPSYNNIPWLSPSSKEGVVLSSQTKHTYTHSHQDTPLSSYTWQLCMAIGTGNSCTILIPNTCAREPWVAAWARWLPRMLRLHVRFLLRLHWFILCTRRSGVTAYEGGGSATRSSPLGCFSTLLQVVDNLHHIRGSRYSTGRTGHRRLLPEPWFSVVASFLQFIPTALCNSIPPLSMW